MTDALHFLRARVIEDAGYAHTSRARDEVRTRATFVSFIEAVQSRSLGLVSPVLAQAIEVLFFHTLAVYQSHPDFDPAWKLRPGRSPFPTPDDLPTADFASMITWQLDSR